MLLFINWSIGILRSDDLNNKKQRHIDLTADTLNVDQQESNNNPQVATIEPYLLPSNEQADTDYIIIHDEV